MSDLPPEPPVPNLVRAQVVFHDFSNLPKNQYVNTWHFVRTGGATYAAAVTRIATLLRAFYETAAAPSTDAVGKHLAAYLARSYDIKQYNMEIPATTRAPHLTVGTLPSALVTSDLPAEVAVCTSLRGDPGLNEDDDPEPQARGRGRVYIGPLNTQAANTGGGAAYPVPTATFIACLVNATKRLVVDSSAGSPVVPLVVYSRTRDAVSGVYSGWVDNAWDTQRRRGQVASTRNAWTTAA
jgi:hypothetical protein